MACSGGGTTHVQRGSAFDKVTGLPAPMLREAQRRRWYEHACQYTDVKWPAAAPKSRTGIAESPGDRDPGAAQQRP
jgi:hypothetical protein